MARPAATYRGARRNMARRQKLIWREGRMITLIGGFRYGWHASMPQRIAGQPALKRAA